MEAGGNVQEAKKQGGSGGNDQDLSMEEILQSIRRIIAEDDGDKDNKAGAAEAPADAKKAGKKGEDVPGSDVLELTEMLAEDGSVVNVKDEAAAPKKAEAKPEKKAEPEAKPEAKKETSNDVLAKINEALNDPSQAPKAEAAAEKPAEKPVAKEEPAAAEEKPAAAAPAATPAPKESLLSDEAASAAAAQFKRLHTDKDLPEEVHVPSPPFRSGTTVEDLVTEMLRPMMKEWLDSNLPQIVERIVEREVKKLTR